MVFHVVDPATGEPRDPGGGPLVLFLPPEAAGWWAMAALSARLPEGYLAALATWDGWGEAAGTPFGGVAAETRAVVAWACGAAPGGLAAVVGCGLGGQVAVEAAAARPRLARALMVGDVLCREVPGSALSARLTGAAWRLMGGPAGPGGDPARARARVARRRRYVASQMDGLAVPRVYLDSFADDVCRTPRSCPEAMVAAVESWRPPAMAAPAVPCAVTVGGLSSRPYRESADDLARVLGAGRPTVARDLSRNELYLRYPDRAAETLAALLAPARP